MVGLGAGTDDAAEIRTALSVCPDTTSFAELGSTVSSLQTTSDSLNVSIANGVFVDEAFSLNPDYVSDLSQGLGASPPTSVDFVNSATDAKNTINAFVSANTNGIIPAILSKDPEPDTVLFLVNALYFGAKWITTFDMAYPQKFRDPSQGVEGWAQMMTETMYVSLARGGTYSAISLPYRPEGGGYEMLIIKPEGCVVEGDGDGAQPIRLAQLIGHDCLDSLLDDAITKTSSDVTPMERTKVAIPRWHIKWRAEETLMTSLKSMGMNKVFSPNDADLSGIPADGDANLYVSQVAHMADVKVNEQGTEAAAATSIGISVTSMPVEPPQEFRADEPFVYAILHRPTATILFAGWVNMDSLEMEGPITDVEATADDVDVCSSAGPTCLPPTTAKEDDGQNPDATTNGDEETETNGDEETNGGSGEEDETANSSSRLHWDIASITVTSLLAFVALSAVMFEY